jgi:hypothetical protein
VLSHFPTLSAHTSHLALYSALALHTATPSVHVLPHFLDISAFLRLSLTHWTAFPRFGLLSHALPGVPLAPPGHIIPSLPHSLSVPLFLDCLAMVLVYNACNYTLDQREFSSLFPSRFQYLRALCSSPLTFPTVPHPCAALAKRTQRVPDPSGRSCKVLYSTEAHTDLSVPASLELCVAHPSHYRQCCTCARP